MIPIMVGAEWMSGRGNLVIRLHFPYRDTCMFGDASFTDVNRQTRLPDQAVALQAQGQGTQFPLHRAVSPP